MRHTFIFGHSHPHRAYMLTRQEVHIVDYREGLLAVVRKIWRDIMRSIAKSKQRRLDRELSLRGVKYLDSDTPRLPVFFPDKWDY